VNDARVQWQHSIEVRSVIRRSERMLNRVWSHGCWSWFVSILDLAIAELRSCFSVKGTELVLTGRIVFGVAKA
jgi:hypothetical protein